MGLLLTFAVVMMVTAAIVTLRSLKSANENPVEVI